MTKQTNLDRYKNDLDSLLAKGRQLQLAMKVDCFPDLIQGQIKEKLGDEAEEFMTTLPNFSTEYQSWYSEAVVVMSQLLPERLSDFVRHYEKPKSRKDISYENYRIEDYLQRLEVTRSGQTIVGVSAGIPHFEQQLAILNSVKARFESSLFDIRQLVQADLLDSELDAAQELAKKGFARAAGAMAGVVLEKHLAQVSDKHGIKFRKKAPAISDLNNALKSANVVDVPEWRFIQHLADLRNLCDHNKKTEPTVEQVDGLIAGVMQVSKTLF